MAKKLYQVLPKVAGADPQRLVLLGTPDGSGPSESIEVEDLIPQDTVKKSLAIAYAVAL